MKTLAAALALLSLTAQAQTSITSFTPAGGNPGSAVITVLGAGLTGMTCAAVSLGAPDAICATPTILSDNKLTFKVPAQQTSSGQITVMKTDVSATSVAVFNTALTPYVPVPTPTCLPLPDLSNVHSSSQTGIGVQTVISCVAPDGTVAWWAFGGSIAEMAQVSCTQSIDWSKNAMAIVGQLWSACIDRAATPDEQGLAMGIAYHWVPRVQVIQAASPVYTIAADGSKTPYQVAGIAQTVTMAPKWGTNNSCLGPATNGYYSMAYRTSDQGVKLPATIDNPIASLSLVGAAVYGSKYAPFTLTYQDGTSTVITRQMSDWNIPQTLPGQTVVGHTTNRITATGAAQAVGAGYSLYGYTLPVDPTKTLVSLTVPSTVNIRIVGIAANPAQAPAPIVAAGATRVVMGRPGVVQTSAGFDGAGNVYDATALSSVTYNGTVFPLSVATRAFAGVVVMLPVVKTTPLSTKAAYAACSIVYAPKDIGFNQ